MAGRRIEPIPKDVIILRSKLGGMFVSDSSIDLSLYAEKIADIQTCIEKGDPIPDRYYRQSARIDHLLSEQG